MSAALDHTGVTRADGKIDAATLGSRTAFSQAFMRDLAEVWSEEGREAMVETA
jgi:hypothetical protein